MGGNIGLHSELGKGSTLSLKLPAGALGQVALVTPEKPAAADGAEALQIPELPYRLLAVDDRRDILHVVQHILEDAGATVSTASGAAEAFDKVHKAQAASSGFQAIVLDIQMPGINGYDAATVLRVEDHVESAQVLVRLLERLGRTVHSAHSAAQPMSVLESIQPTVILSDIGLPDEDGNSLVARMRKHHGLKG